MPLAQLAQQAQPPASSPEIPLALLAQEVQQPASSPEIPLALLLHAPARMIGNSRHANHGRQACAPHPYNRNLLYCSKGQHYVPRDLFGRGQICTNCLQNQRERRARNQGVLNALHVAPSQPQQMEHNQINAEIADDLQQPAVSAAEKTLLSNFRGTIMGIQLELCNYCNEKWFDLKVEHGKCKKCRRNTKFQEANVMDPGLIPEHLPELTQMEEMLIAPVHVLMQIWQVRGGQYKYTGHICNFLKDNAQFYNRVPVLPENVEIILMKRGDVDIANESKYRDFRVRRAAIQQWLAFLSNNHPTFQQQVQIDHGVLDQLPEDECVHERVKIVSVQEMDGDLFEESGPPEDDNHDGDNIENEQPIYSNGFIPNVHETMTVMDQLRTALPPVILTMPQLRNTPINEHTGRAIAVDAFPTIFAYGKADITAVRNQQVSLEDWAGHLLRYRDGQFARHPRFRYWLLNTIMRKKAKSASTWYVNSHHGDRDLSIEEIRDMVQAGQSEALAKRVSHAGEKLEGSRPFWAKARWDLTAQIRSPQCGTPHVFFTASSADIQWPDLHQHMPSYNADQNEDATSYRVRMEDLNNNPAIAAYYFQMRWMVFFNEYIKPKFKVTDYWWRYEWQHHGSSHVHGFFWLADAPNIDNLDLSSPVSIQNFINFWDNHVSTWHPFKACPPAAIHPSACLFQSLEDTKKELAEMLNRLQRHTYCKPGYCERSRKSTGEKFCRFGFSKENHDTTVLIRENENGFPELYTKRNDPLLNSNNSGVILGWRANI